MDRNNKFSLKLPPVSLCLLFLTAVAKNLELSKFKEILSVTKRRLFSKYQTTFKFLVVYVFLKFAKHSLSLSLSLVRILSKNFFFVESVLPHIQNQAISLDSAVVYVSVKNFEG
jgi:hypothetical protein